MDDYFFWCGVAVNAIGAFGVCGFLAWRALEWWIKFNNVRKPLLLWYADQLLRKKHPRMPG